MTEPLLPPTLPNLWRVFGLRESPYFQDSLGPSAYPLSLFVGRKGEAAQLLTTIGSSPHSRQAVAGPPGIGKTTLVQFVKAQAVEAGYWAADELVPLFPGDSAGALIGRILVSLYDTILAQRPNAAGHEAMRRAQQMVKVSRLQTAQGGGFSAAGFGASASASHALNTPADHLLLEGPAVVRDLLALVAAESRGVLLHLNNLESLTERDAKLAAEVVRSLRDPILMRPGLHTLVVGPSEAVQLAIQQLPQVRSVFSPTLALAPLSARELRGLLHERYRYLAHAGEEWTPPIADDAVSALYADFRGDLRSALAAFEQGAKLLAGAVPPPIGDREIRPVLREVYRARCEADLGDLRVAQLDRWGRGDPSGVHTQKSLRALWGVSQASVSDALEEFRRKGYVLALPRDGAAATPYALSGNSRLIYG